MIDYVKEVNAYGKGLQPVSKCVARDVFSSLLQEGYDYEWIYFAIMNLGSRDIACHRGLFFYKPFRDEVTAMVFANREAELHRQQEQARICEAIEQQILQAKQNNITTVNIYRPKSKKKHAAEILAAVNNMEDSE